MDIYQHSIKKKLDAGVAHPTYVRFFMETADVLTKDLAAASFLPLISNLGMVNIHKPARGGNVNVISTMFVGPIQ